MGPRSVVLGGGTACGRRYWDLRWSSLMRPQSAVLGRGTACGLRHWDLRWSFLWGDETLHWAQEPNASPSTGTSD
eukprot:9436874-Pyramimonas_sp.AAC.1